jgi:hypothetical protein
MKGDGIEEIKAGLVGGEGRDTGEGAEAPFQTARRGGGGCTLDPNSGIGKKFHSD